MDGAFKSMEEYKDKASNLRNDFGEPVEEFAIEFIDGTVSALFNSIGDHCGMEKWFDCFEDLDEDEYIKACYLAQIGYDPDEILSKLEDVYLFEGTALEYAYDYIDSCGMLDDAPDIAKRYFNYEAFADDLLTSGDISELNFDGTDYIVQNSI